jgi:hypothetical protein
MIVIIHTKTGAIRMPCGSLEKLAMLKQQAQRRGYKIEVIKETLEI